MEKVWAFWEGPMPEYLKLCMETWRFPYTLLNYESLQDYMELPKELEKFTLPQIADYIRVHLLRDQGGYWLDTDTIMIEDKLPEANIMGRTESRANTIGMLHTKAHSHMFECWAKYQDAMIEKAVKKPELIDHWDIMGNAFTDIYVRTHSDIKIAPVTMCWPETYVIQGSLHRRQRYEIFYFAENHTLSELLPTEMLMLHNSWTPSWFKRMSRDEVLNRKCTISDILREVL